MKSNITCLIFTALIVLSSCTSTKATTDDQAKPMEKTHQEASIIGRWLLVKLSGGITGREQDPPMGQTIVIEFTPTEMITTINGKETSRVIYTLGKGKSIHSTSQIPMIFTNGNDSMGKSYHLENDKLGISEEVHDGFYYSYIKIGKDDDGIPRK
ncbi:hypothetical protein HX001_07825 [Empedobacter brevis]|uniref:Lipocalin-like domain-containing protein n=1 Tax=Empedobacter brevis TaxID=247 RepID=A0AAJ1V8X0_9FLAO|nr:hypothetical protein [Empedobacter brevis]MDM1072395.1 hypothetical protein [Empedobacter brevis]